MNNRKIDVADFSLPSESFQAEPLPPGPRWPAPLQVLAYTQLPRFMRYCRRRYGDRFTVRGGAFGTFVYLTDPNDIREVFRGDDETFHAGEANAPFLSQILGPSSVLCVDEQLHLRQRRRLAGPFHGESVARLAPVMSDIAAEDVATWPVGEEFSVLPHMRKLTLEVILRAVIGVTDRDESQLNELRSTLSALADLDLVTMLAFGFPALSKIWPWSQYAAVQRQADRLIRDEIERCQSADDLEQRPDVLAMLVRGNQDGMTTSELRDQLVTLLMAGHETTATALSWTFERLVRHPAVLAKTQRAAREGDNDYLDAVVTESLRVRPVVPDVSRRLVRDVTIGTGDRELRLPAGIYVDPALHLVLRSEEHYPDPLAFRPERFVGKRPDLSVWLPFGGGNRRCLGAAFALTEMRVVLSTILQRVDLATTTHRDERVRVRHVTLAPSRGARIMCQPQRTGGVPSGGVGASFLAADRESSDPTPTGT